MKLHRLLVAAVTAVLLATAAAPALALEVPPDINALEYEPIGHFKPGDPLPAANAYQADNETGEFLRQEYADGIFNPSGTFNAYDTNVFETLMLPFRAAARAATRRSPASASTTSSSTSSTTSAR